MPFTKPCFSFGKYFGKDVTPIENIAPPIPNTSPPITRSVKEFAMLMKKIGNNKMIKLMRKMALAPYRSV